MTINFIPLVMTRKLSLQGYFYGKGIPLTTAALGRQLMSMLKKTFPSRPSCGWIQTIREALVMTAVSHAQRFHVRSATIGYG